MSVAGASSTTAYGKVSLKSRGLQRVRQRCPRTVMLPLWTVMNEVFRQPSGIVGSISVSPDTTVPCLSKTRNRSPSMPFDRMAVLNWSSGNPPADRISSTSSWAVLAVMNNFESSRSTATARVFRYTAPAKPARARPKTMVYARTIFQVIVSISRSWLIAEAVSHSPHGVDERDRKVPVDFLAQELDKRFNDV